MPGSSSCFIEHIVLLKLARQFTVAEAADLQTGILSIPGVLSISQGPNYTSRSLEYNYGIVVRLVSKEAEAAYQLHPEHVRVRDTIIKPNLAKGADGTPPVLAMDYACQAAATPMPWRLVAAAGLGVLLGLTLAKYK